ncbi:MAG: sensor histidine kinase [Candidatus Brocadiales bacterium]|nr:sensor histidine kinase [Candidatus Brocadiales bacterium]
MTEQKILLDISETRWAWPFGSLLIASQIRKLTNEGIEFELSGFDENRRAHSYLGHIGFFDLMGFSLGKKIGEAVGNHNYLPITRLKKDEISNIHESGMFYKSIQLKAEELAQLLTGSYDYKKTRPVAYCFRELIRNVFEHAGSDDCYFSGQGYQDGRVLIGIVDNGIGLKESLKNQHSVKSDFEAIEHAILPGVSGKHIDPKDENPWANTGFGLYVLSEIGRKMGYFSITTGDSIYCIEEKKGSTHKDAFHRGTAINIVFSKPKGKNLDQEIKNIIEAGEIISKTQGRTSKASKSSKTI